MPGELPGEVLWALLGAPGGPPWALVRPPFGPCGPQGGLALEIANAAWGMGASKGQVPGPLGHLEAPMGHFLVVKGSVQGSKDVNGGVVGTLVGCFLDPWSLKWCPFVPGT